MVVAMEVAKEAVMAVGLVTGAVEDMAAREAEMVAAKGADAVVEVMEAATAEDLYDSTGPRVPNEELELTPQHVEVDVPPEVEPDDFYCDQTTLDTIRRRKSIALIENPLARKARHL